MKILAITGSPRKKGNCQTIINLVHEKIRQLDPGGEVRYLYLSDLNLEHCRGCCSCFNKGENFCPHRTTVAEIIKLMNENDALIFASPVYAHQVTALMKNFIDHMAFLFHRPQFAGKPVLIIATTDGSGLKETLHYLNFTATGWGLYLIGSFGIINSAYHWSASYRTKFSKDLAKAVKKLEGLQRTGQRPQPTFYELCYFRDMRQKASFIPCDKAFWEEKDWFRKNYYLNISIHPFKAWLANQYENLSKMLTTTFIKKMLNPEELAAVRKRIQSGQGDDYDQQLMTFIDSLSQ